MLKESFGIFRSFWRAAFRPFFLSEHGKYRIIAYAGASIIFALTLANVWGAVMLSYQLNKLGFAVQHGASVDEYSGIATWIIGIIVLFIMTDTLVHNLIRPVYAWYWQESLMIWYIDHWNKRASEVEGTAQRIKDCSKTIADDVSVICVRVLRCFMGLIAFIPVAWQLSEYFQFLIPIPGILLWLMFVICAFETTVSWLLGRRLPQLEKNRQRADALVRSNLEMIQRDRLEKGKGTSERVAADKRHALSALEMLRKTTFAIIFGTIPLTVWQHLYGNFWGFGLQVILAWFVTVLKIFAYGIMWQTISVLGELHKSLSVFSDSWQMITLLQGTVERVKQVEETTE